MKNYEVETQPIIIIGLYYKLAVELQFTNFFHVVKRTVVFRGGTLIFLRVIYIKFYKTLVTFLLSIKLDSRALPIVTKTFFRQKNFCAVLENFLEGYQLKKGFLSAHSPQHYCQYLLKKY